MRPISSRRSSKAVTANPPISRGRRLAKRIEHPGHVHLPLQPRHHDVEQLVAEIAELAVEVVEVIDQRASLPLLEERGLRQQQRGAGGILVADLGGGEDAVALFRGDHEVGRRAANVAVLPGRFQLRDHIGVVLEADEQIVDHLRAELSADSRDLTASSPPW